MAYFFSLTPVQQKKLSAVLGTEFIDYLKDAKQITTEEEYNAALSEIVKRLKTKTLSSTAARIFKDELREIALHKPLTEPVVWGGVSLKKVDVAKNLIRKLLVVKRLGILGFEIHKVKHEKLRILEGTCLVLYSNHHKKEWRKGEINLAIGTPGNRFEFYQGDEHGIIAVSDCVIEETSTNHLDDLVYIFPSKQII